MPIDLYANNATTTLNEPSGITAGATSITVAASTGFPTPTAGVSQFRVLIGSEILIVTAVSGTTWTVTRGAESTTAASHSDGAAVTMIVTAGALDSLAQVPTLWTEVDLSMVDLWYDTTFVNGMLVSAQTGGNSGWVYFAIDLDYTKDWIFEIDYEDLNTPEQDISVYSVAGKNPDAPASSWTFVGARQGPTPRNGTTSLVVSHKYAGWQMDPTEEGVLFEIGERPHMAGDRGPTEHTKVTGVRYREAPSGYGTGTTEEFRASGGSVIAGEVTSWGAVPLTGGGEHGSLVGTSGPVPSWVRSVDYLHLEPGVYDVRWGASTETTQGPHDVWIFIDGGHQVPPVPTVQQHLSRRITITSPQHISTVTPYRAAWGAGGQSTLFVSFAVRKIFDLGTG